MYPNLTYKTVEKPTTLRDFITKFGEDTLYAYDRRVLGVIVNGKRLWDSAKLKSGDEIIIYPIIVGG